MKGLITIGTIPRIIGDYFIQIHIPSFIPVLIHRISHSGFSSMVNPDRINIAFEHVAFMGIAK